MLQGDRGWCALDTRTSGVALRNCSARRGVECSWRAAKASRECEGLRERSAKDMLNGYKLAFGSIAERFMVG